MAKMNFPMLWREWILECVTNATTYVLVSGSPTDEFKLEKGLGEGDPLSPFLFLLAAEGFNVMMNALVLIRLFTGYIVGAQTDMSVSHLQFVDDTMLIGTKSWVSIRSLKAILILFEEVSDLFLAFFFWGGGGGGGL